MILAFLLLGLLQPRPAVPGPAAPPEDGQLVVLLEVDPIDRGAAAPGERISRKVSIQNVGDKPVSLRTIDKTCGCVDVTFGVELLKPGQVTVMEMVVAAAEAEGRQAQLVTLGATEIVTDGPSRTQTSRVGLTYTPTVAYVVRPTHASVAASKGSAATVEFTVRAIENQVLQELRAEAKPDGAWTAPLVVIAADRRTARVSVSPRSEDRSTFGTVRITGKSGALTLVAEVQRFDALRLGLLTRCGEGEYRCDLLNVPGGSRVAPAMARLIAGPDNATCELEPLMPGRNQTLKFSLRRCSGRVGFGRVQITDARGVELAQSPWATPDPK